jgi:hypothetical protein
MSWVATGLKMLKTKLKIMAPASIHNPIKIIQDRTFNTFRIKSFFFDITVKFSIMMQI